MSAEIKITAQTTPSAVVKVKGKCYSLVQAAVPGKPDTTVDSITDTFSTCADCLNSGNVPNACPVGLSAYYKLNISTPHLGSCTPYDFAGTLWDGVIGRYGSTCYWRLEMGLTNVQYVTTSSINFYGVGVYSGAHNTHAAMGLIANKYWYAWALSGDCRGIWLKRDGATPVGTYISIGNGVTNDDLGMTCTWISPTSITVSETT